jgi:mannose-6-phosphate isomerase-like protein (cupin superfamily)
MKRTILCLVSVALLAPAVQSSARAQTPAPAAAPRPSAPFVPAPAQNGPIPTVAFDITKADIDFVLKNAPANPPDRQLRVVDMGKYNLGVGVIHRGPTNDKPSDPIQMIYHDFTPEVYIITSGSGVLTTGGVIENRRAGAGVPNVMNGPSGGGTAGAGAYSRVVSEGDIIIIPTMVAHGWSQIKDHVTYLSVRPDPERALPSGYVYPLLLKNLPTPPPKQ